MKYILILFLALLSSTFVLAQTQTPADQNIKKGRMYFYWGWNQSWYNTSNIKFSGEDYNFELKKVVANDRQSSFGLDPYLNPANATIPQYNFRIGYFIKDNWDISFGIDHMKYVVQAYQTVKISGEINDPQTLYNGYYDDDDIMITPTFLQFEHTDGLNYANVSLRRFDEIIDLNPVTISLTEGIGLGALYPRTNTSLMNKERYDEFHWSGFGLDAMVGINATFWKVFFIQSEFKAGYINMPDIRTTHSTADKASQSFFFSQINILFGGVINLSPKSKNKP